MTPDASAFANQFNPVALAFENRTWTDTDRSGLNLPTNGDGIAQDNEIGPSGNPNFGKITNRTLDPELHARVQPAVQRRDPARAAAGDGGHASTGTAATAVQHAIQRRLQRQRDLPGRTPTGRRSRSSTR